MARKISGAGTFGSMAALKASLKKSASAGIRTIKPEESLTVRFLNEPAEFGGYNEHYVGGKYKPCVTDECEGCGSDNPEERRKQYKYLANAYVVDEQKVMVLKLPKTLVEQLVEFYTKYKGTLLDRDYDLTRRGSSQNDTKYMAVPDSPQRMKMERFQSKMVDLDDLLETLANEDDIDLDDEDDKPRKKKSKSSSDRPKKNTRPPWDEEDDEDEDDDEDEPPRRPKKSSSVKKSAPKKTTTARRTVRRK